MTHEQRLNAVAPCSLLCYTCFGYMDGGVCEHATELYELCKGWYEGHARAYALLPTRAHRKTLRDIQGLNESLRGFMQPKCPGCRKCGGSFGGCIKGCIIPVCAKEHGVNFCAECGEFPCDRKIPGKLKKAWLEGNNYIKEHGLEQYFETRRRVAHYIELYNPKNDK